MDDSDTLHFGPVPVRARRDGWSADRQRRFIAFLRAGASPSLAAPMVGMSRESAYRLRNRPGAESFAAAWDAALDRSAPTPSGPTANQRAFEGVLVPVTYRGRQVGVRRKYDDRAACNLLRAHWRRHGGWECIA